MTKELVVALAGNPNCGKSTLFNELTGGRQHVSNYPGITVERKEGFLTFDGLRLKIVDLPGTYSLTAYSIEELVARDFIVDEKPHVVVNIVDATSLDRHLYLTIQLLELGVPVVLVLNMMDMVEQRGITIDRERLEKRLGIPIVPMVARIGKGKEELIRAIVETAHRHPRSNQKFTISYGPDIDHHLHEMERIIAEQGFLVEKYPPRWVALKYLEEDRQIIEKGDLADRELSERLKAMAGKIADHIAKTLDTYPEAVIADYRYGFITALLKDGVVQRPSVTSKRELTDILDRFLTNRLLGPIIMVFVLYLVYTITFKYSELPVEWVNRFFGLLASYGARALPEGPLRSLIVDGIIGGVGNVFSFVPLIVLMFLCIAILEDTGYLARVAYMLDRVFRIFGLHGNSVMALIIGGGIAGGCAVPGVMATRTLRSSKERLATILVTPFMNCGAKLPVYAMIIATFFEAGRAQIMLILTILSWMIALSAAWILRSTVLRGPSTPFLLELPVYRLPTLKGLLIHTWERTWQYMKKAGTLIVAITVLLWALMSYPKPPEEVLNSIPPESHSQFELEYSIAGRLGKSLSYITKFCGFDWKINVALFGGFAAKEVILSTLGTAYALGTEDEESTKSLSERIRNDPHWTPLMAWVFMVFVMIYAPCMATLVVIAKETGSLRWSIFSLVFNTAIAFMLAVGMYQGGLALGLSR
ncbi:MAG: ferrous iron transport protein B [Syntrophobacterales bacterium]|nr:ferrous iron transport protein B [Syntrophobacterales bacterium]